MKVIGIAIVGSILLLLAYFLITSMAQLSDAEAQRIDASARLQDAWGRSQAGIIQAEGQSRLNSAQAFAVTAGAALPWLITGLLGTAGLVLIASVFAMLVLGLQVARAGQQERALLWAMAHQALPERREYLALEPSERERVIEL